jgi:hypothetical protein
LVWPKYRHIWRGRQDAKVCAVVLLVALPIARSISRCDWRAARKVSLAGIGAMRYKDGKIGDHWGEIDLAS